MAVLASQGTIRHNVALTGSLDPDQRRAARDQVERALTQGAVGLSSGLDYLPSRYGDPAEVADWPAPWPRPAARMSPTCGATARRGRRPGRADRDRPAFRRPRARQPPVGCAARHRNGVRRRRHGRRAAFFDAYPDRRSSTILAMLLLPPELQADGPDQTVAALADPEQRARLLASDRFTPEYLAHVYLAALPTEHA